MPSLLHVLSDPLLSVPTPVPAYWLTAAYFPILDFSNAPWLLHGRIHDSTEVVSRNAPHASEDDVSSMSQGIGSRVQSQRFTTFPVTTSIDSRYQYSTHWHSSNSLSRLVVAGLPTPIVCCLSTIFKSGQRRNFRIVLIIPCITFSHLKQSMPFPCPRHGLLINIDNKEVWPHSGHKAVSYSCMSVSSY